MTHEVCPWVWPQEQWVQESSQFRLKVSMLFIWSLSTNYLIFHTGAVFRALNDTRVVATMNTSVTLSCEIYGYLPRGSIPQITWRRMNGEMLSRSSPPYMLSMSNGTEQIQNGGTSPQPSYVSSLTIDVMDRSVEDTYICSRPSFVFQNIELNISGGTCNNFSCLFMLIS